VSAVFLLTFLLIVYTLGLGVGIAWIYDLSPDFSIVNANFAGAEA